MNKKAIIVGSAPISSGLKDRNLSGYYRVCLNKAWQIRPDFEAHVFLNSLKMPDRPPADYGAQSIDRSVFARAVTKAGGPYLASMTAAAAAGYWMITQQTQRIVTFYGCDMVYPKQGPTHFYNGGDTGPMLGTFAFNSAYPQKFARLFVFGLLHRVVVLNGSGEKGTQLSLPIVPLGRENMALVQSILTHPQTHEVLRLGVDALITEETLRTPAFEQRVHLFNEDTAAIEILQEMNAAWDPVVEQMAVLQRVINRMFKKPVNSAP